MKEYDLESFTLKDDEGNSIHYSDEDSEEQNSYRAPDQPSARRQALIQQSKGTIASIEFDNSQDLSSSNSSKFNESSKKRNKSEELQESDS